MESYFYFGGDEWRKKMQVALDTMMGLLTHDKFEKLLKL